MTFELSTLHNTGWDAQLALTPGASSEKKKSFFYFCVHIEEREDKTQEQVES